MNIQLTLDRTVRQQSIVEAARKIIFLKGIESLTVREIAKELGITNAALYRHFRSKSEIIRLLIDDIEETLLSTIREAANIQGSPLERLNRIFLSHLSYSERMKGTSFIIINEVSGFQDKSLKRKMFGVLNGYLKIIQNIIIEGKMRGDFRKDINPVASSVAFFGLIQSIVTLWGLSGHKIPLKKIFLEQEFNVFKKGII